MPSFYLKKKKCDACNRSYEGLRIGSGEKNQPFVFKLNEDMTPDNFLSKYIALFSCDDVKVINQWLTLCDKKEFLNNVEACKNNQFTHEYIEHDSIKINDLGYHYSEIDLHLKV